MKSGDVLPDRTGCLYVTAEHVDKNIFLQIRAAEIRAPALPIENAVNNMKIG